MKSSLGRVILLLVLTMVWGISKPYQAFADDSTADIEKRLNDLEQQVADLKQELWKKKQASPANVTASAKDGFAIKSEDGNFSLKIGGYTQFLSRDFGANNKEELGQDSAFLLRRARLIIQGTVAGKFDYYLQPEFGYNNNFTSITATSTSSYAPALQDAWISYRLNPDFAIKAGKYKTPFDLENLQDSRLTDFVELGLTNNLSPQRDIGVQASGNLYFDWITYAAGVFNGAADHENAYGGTSTAGYESNNISGVGRVFALPFKDTSIEPLQKFGIGYAVSYGKEKGNDIPTSYVTTGQAPFFSYNSGVQNDGPQLRTEPQAYFYYKSLGILAEKVNDDESLEYFSGTHVYRDKVGNKAFNVEGSYVLTGEDASYNGVTPKHDFDPANGHWGAFELAGRYGEIRMDNSIFSENFANLNTSALSATAWSGGLNWYLNKNAKVVFDYEHTYFDRGAYLSSGGNRKDEDLFLTMLQLSLG